MKSKILIFIILITLIVGCAGNTTEPSDETKPQLDTSSDILKSAVPDNLKFDGNTVRFYSYYTENRNTDIILESAPDIVNDAIYTRNMVVQDKLDVKFEGVFSSEESPANNNGLMTKSVNAGLDEYDIIIGVQWICTQIATSNIFKNIIDLPYLGLENPWWADRYMKEMTVGNNVVMFLIGDISVGMMMRASTMYFNKDLYTDNLGDPDEMYQFVLDNKWTMDAFAGKIKDIYRDLNGDGVSDVDDQYGFMGYPVVNPYHFMYASGVRVTQRDKNGIPYFDFNNQKTVNFIEKLYDLFYNNKDAYTISQTVNEFWETTTKKFMSNEVLFRAEFLSHCESLRSMQTNFGMIPFPKCDEHEQSYHALVNTAAPLYCVLITCTRDELVSAVLEEMAFQGYMYMTPAYFEMALKNKYMRDSDDKAMQCLDLIWSNPTTDFAMVYNNALSGIGGMAESLMVNKSSAFVSEYRRIEDKATEQLQAIIDLYIK